MSVFTILEKACVIIFLIYLHFVLSLLKIAIISMLSVCTSVLFVTCVYSSLWSWVIIIIPRLLTINQAPMTYCYYVLFKYCDGMPTVCNTAQCPCNHMRHSIPSQCPRGMFRVLIREELCIPNLVLACRSMNWVSGKTRWG